MKYYFNVAVANGINKLGWTPDVPDEHLGMKFGPTCHEVITICEEIEKLVEEWPLVHGDKDAPHPIWSDRTGTTHKARLAFIEEIKKEPCKHEVYVDVPLNKDLIFTGASMYRGPIERATCRRCGVVLFATWSEKK